MEIDNTVSYVNQLFSILLVIFLYQIEKLKLHKLAELTLLQYLLHEFFMNLLILIHCNLEGICTV